jgi:hypothetical protein
MSTRRNALAVIALAASLSTACTHSVAYQESSHRPAVVADEKLIYDASLDVYVVSSHPNCYYSAGQYFRHVESGWEWSVSVAGTWKPVPRASDVPPGLRAKHGD